MTLGTSNTTHSNPQRLMATSLVRSLICAVLILGLAAPQALAKTHRDPAQRAAFTKMYPCPSTGKTKGRCPGYVVDHVVPLCAGGRDYGVDPAVEVASRSVPWKPCAGSLMPGHLVILHTSLNRANDLVTCLKQPSRTPRWLAAGAPPWRRPSFLDLRAIPPVFSGRGLPLPRGGTAAKMAGYILLD